MFSRDALEITLFTDPACPFAFSAEPVRRRLMWHYGDQLRWRTRMIVLTLEPGEAEKLAEGAPTLQRRYGMPIDPAPYAAARFFRTRVSRRRCDPASCPGARAGSAATFARPHHARRVARRPATAPRLPRDVGIDPSELTRWCAEERDRPRAVGRRRGGEATVPCCAGSRSQAGRSVDARRYTAPSYEITRAARRKGGRDSRLQSGRDL